MRQKCLVILILAVLCSLAVPFPGLAAGTDFSIRLNDRPVVFDVPPSLENDRLLVPLRAVLEAMGANVSWNSDTGTAVAILPGATIAVAGGSKEARINGNDFPLAVAAEISQGRLIVPLQLITEATGAQSDWDGATRTLSLYTEDPGHDFPALLLDLQRNIQDELDRMDQDLAAAAGKLSLSDLDGDETRLILSGLAARYPYVVDSCTVDPNGTIMAIEPAAYHQFSGSDISHQEQIGRLWETRRPVLSSAFLAVEGFTAVDLERPVFNRQNELIGSVSLLIKPELLFSNYAGSGQQEPWPEIMAMQEDGYILYDTDSSQIGRISLTDPLYQNHPDLISLIERMAADKSGAGTYTFPEQVLKRSYWTTVGLHGMEWRLIANYPDAETP